jgi:hypothetical protein
MAQKEPAARKNALQLLLVDLPLDENAAADEAIFRVDEISDVHLISLSSNPSRYEPFTSAVVFDGVNSCATRLGGRCYDIISAWAKRVTTVTAESL